MEVIRVGDMEMDDGEEFSGLLVKADREELQEVAGKVLYREVIILPIPEDPDKEEREAK